MNVIPQGDKPNVSITYPNANTYNSSTHTDSQGLGGTIRITGSPEIAIESVEGIYLQIDPDYDGTFNENWDTEVIVNIADNPETSENEEAHYALDHYYNIATTYRKTTNGNTTTEPLPNTIGKGIKASGAAVSWSLTLNQNKELNEKVGSNKDKNRIVAVRAYAVSTTGKVSSFEQVTFSVDPDAPLVGNKIPMELVQFESEHEFETAHITAKQNYSLNMWIKGKWYLHFSAEDDSGIDRVDFTDNGTVKHLVTNSGIAAAYNGSIPANGKVIAVTDDNAEDYGWGENRGYDIYMPVGSDALSYGCLSYAVEIDDKSSPVKTGYGSATLWYDNQPPTVEATGSSNANNFTATGNRISQSNGTYMVKGRFTEISTIQNVSQSGFKRIAMYYTRTGTRTEDTGSNTYLVDPLQAPGEDGDSNWYLISGNSPELVEKDDMYWMPVASGSVTGAQLTVSLTKKQYMFARAGYLIMINNVPYMMKEVTPKLYAVDNEETDEEEPNLAAWTSGTKEVTITLDTSFGTEAITLSNLYLGSAQIIDNTSSEVGSETNQTGIYDYSRNTSDQSNPLFTNDDGDQMIEGVTVNGAAMSWTANIDSSNIYDGPVTLHFTAFDVAGNTNHVSYQATVENNVPRFASLKYGTDEDGSGEVEDGELNRYYASWQNGIIPGTNGLMKTSIVVEDEYRLNVKGKVKIIPEIIGGNKGLGYTYGYKNISGTDSTSPMYNLVNGHATTSRPASSTVVNMPVSEFLSNNVGDGEQRLTFTVYDRTIYDAADAADDTSNTIYDHGYDTRPNVGTNRATFSLPVNIMIRDTTPPTAWFEPFYWNSVSNNSIYGSSSATKLSDLVGHIELESDWENDGGYSSAAVNGITDKDPKVSGKVTIKGSANDNVLVKEIWVKVTNLTTADGFVKVAERSTTEGNDHGWIATENANNLDNGLLWERVSETSSQQNGNTVNFKLHFNTEKITGVADKDIVVQVRAEDKGCAYVESGSSTVKYGLKTNTGTDESPVWTYTENKGNMSSTTSTINTTESSPTSYYRMDVVPYITSLDRPDAKTSTHRSRRGKYQVVLSEDLKITGFNLPGTATSTNDATKGIKLQTTAAKDSSTNGSGIATKTRTESVNGTNTTITSDVHKMIFAAQTTSGYIKVVTNSIPSINNFNSASSYNTMEKEYTGDDWHDDVYLSVWKNDEYFSFSNDPISPSMDRIANGKGQYRLYGGWGTQGSMFYASYPNTSGSGTSGNAPSPASGTDATSKTSQDLKDPPTFYDVAIDGQNRYNVLLDCWQGGNDGLGWGRNFVMNRNGIFSRNGTNEVFTNSNANDLYRVIERMGAYVKPDNADSSDGLDEIFNQFLNPRITVYNGSAFLCYYDRYAKCLKWAVMGDFDNNNKPATKYATEGKITGGNFTGSTFTNNGHTISSYYTNGGLVVAGYDTTVSGGTSSTLNSGLWSDIAIDTSEGWPVIAYYEMTGSTKHLMVATGYKDTEHSADTTYPINKTGDLAPVITSTKTPTSQGSAWKRQEVTGSAALRLGEYVSLALDGGNNIHIACKGAKDGALYYVYGARSAYGSYTWTTVCVDNNGSPGNWTDIKLTNPSASGAAAGPVISYYDPTNDATEDALKVAYLESTTSNAAENWDTMTVPCNSAATSNRITLALDVTDGVTYTDNGTTNNSKLAIGYVSSRFDCVYLRQE